MCCKIYRHVTKRRIPNGVSPISNPWIALLPATTTICVFDLAYENAKTKSGAGGMLPEATIVGPARRTVKCTKLLFHSMPGRKSKVAQSHQLGLSLHVGLP